MRIIPVIDVKDGIVVRAVGGRRAEYRPLQSRLTRSTEPVVVARAMIEATSATELYIADLDGLMHGSPNSLLRALADELDVEVWLDVGLRTWDESDPIERVRPIIATETFLGKAHGLRPLGLSLDQSTILSLDYRAGSLVSHREWNPADFATVIVLDVASVGTGNGVPTLAKCEELRLKHPDLEIVTGGGVRNRDDLKRLKEVGVDAALVASALHEGRF